MLARLSTRQVFLAIFLGCTGLIIAALILQHFKGMQPCPMCIMQRYAFVACGLIALAGAAHGPGQRGKRVYAGLIILSAVLGLSVAIRQSWLQWFPSPAAMCGPDLSYMVNAFPLGDLLPMLFNGSGDCSKADPFLGLSLANWGILAFTGFIVVGVWVWKRRDPVTAL